MVEKDPIGNAALDYLLNSRQSSIEVESDLTEMDTIPVHYLFRSYNDMPEKEKFALEHCVGSILDVGAGAGCHSLYLQSKGKQVTAIEISAGCVEVMRKLGVKNIIHDNFVLLSEKEKYDTLLLLMNGFGIAGTLDGLSLLFQKAHQLLKPGGLLIGESTDILYLFEEDDGSVSLDLNAHYYGEMHYRMHFNNHSGDWFPWLYVSYDLLLPIAAEHGFELIHEFKGNDHDYIVVLKKVN